MRSATSTNVFVLEDWAQKRVVVVCGGGKGGRGAFRHEQVGTSPFPGGHP